MSNHTTRDGRTGFPTFGLPFVSDSSATTGRAGLAFDSSNQPQILDDAGNVIFTRDSSSRIQIKTYSDSAAIQLNSRTYTQTSGDTIAGQSTPSQGADTTGEVFGWQFKPRVASGFDAATVNGIGIDSELKGPGNGALSSDLRGINLYLGATGTGTIGGNITCIRARCESNINPTGQILFAHIVNSEGTQGWDGFVGFTEALGTNTMTTNSDKTGNAKSGTIKVRADNGTLYHIQLYADS